MAQDESEITEENSNQLNIPWIDSHQIQIPWINFLTRPQLNFRKPKIALPHKAPHQYIVTVLVIFSLFLLAGGIYDLANAPLPLGYTASGYTPVYPSLSDQFLVESLSVMVFIGIGAAGFFLLKFPTESGKTSDMRSVSFIQAIGLILIFVGIFATYVMLQMKIYGHV